MTQPTWSPTQQIHALLVLSELSAFLATEARARTLFGNRALGETLGAVGKRALPAVIAEMAEWPALRLTRARDTLRAALEQYASSTPWAERITGTATALLREGERFTDAAHGLHRLASAITSVDEGRTRQEFERHRALFDRYRTAHLAEDAASAAVWTQALDLLHKAVTAIGMSALPPPPPPEMPTTGRGEPGVKTSSSTPYQPANATDPGSAVGGSHALRRRVVRH